MIIRGLTIALTCRRSRLGWAVAGDVVDGFQTLGTGTGLSLELHYKTLQLHYKNFTATLSDQYFHFGASITKIEVLLP